MASNAKKNEEIRQFARRFVRVLKIEDGDVILLKTENMADNIDMFNGLRSALGATGRKKCLLVAVKDRDDIEVLSEASMAEYGWHKREDADESSESASSE